MDAARLRGRLGGLVCLALAATSLALAPGNRAEADTAPPVTQPATVSADRLPTVQINGVVWAQVTVGNTVYVTGSFSAARPAGVALGGAGSVTRSNLLAYDIRTGLLNTSFVHTLNAQGRSIAASPDGSRVYVGGSFTSVDGATHNRIAAFDTATGSLVSTFNASLNNPVMALAATNSTVYAGGSFTTADGNARARVAAYTATGGLTTFNPGADSTVNAMTLTGDQTRLVLGGFFNTLAGISAVGMGAVNATTGAAQPWAANTVIQDSGNSATISTLAADANLVYGAGWFFTTGGNFEGRFAANPATGQIVWMNNCHGDSYSVYPIGPVLYSASHEHDCSDLGSFSQDTAGVFGATKHYVDAESINPSGTSTRHPIYPGGNGPGPVYHDFAGQPAGSQLDWYPTLTQGSYTGQSQAAWSVTGNSSFVSVGGEFPTVNGVAQQGLVRFAVSAIAPNKVGPNTAASLTPSVVSQTSGTARVAWQTTWDMDNTSLSYALYRDNGATPIFRTTVGSTFWNRPNLGYLDSGLSLGSTHSYKLTVTDPFGNSITSGSGSVTVGSAANGEYQNLITSDGASHYWPLSEAAGTTLTDRVGYSDLSITGAVTLGSPGPIAGSGASAASFAGGETTPAPTGQPGPPPSPVPNDTAGTVGQSSPAGAFTLEAWVKTTSNAGGAILSEGLFRNTDSAAIDKVLYLDTAGRLHFGVQNNTVKQTIGSSASYNNGLWHLVDATLSGTSASLYVDGVLAAAGSMTDDIAFPGYWRVGGDNLNGWIAAPGGNYLPGTIGSVATYGSALAPAQVATHYASGSGTVVVTNQPPVAAFGASCTALTCSTDASSSADPDGTVATYAWSFGDGAVATGATAGHTYATAGTYPITLTVTDNSGASNSVTHQVSPAAGVSVLADDEFDRTVASGFGTAEPSGGDWTQTGAADLSVAPGAGRISLPAAGRSGAVLNAVSSDSVDLRTTVSLATLPTGGSGLYFYAVGRYVSATEQYLARVRVLSSGAVVLSLSKYDGSSSTETVLAAETTVATVTAGAALDLRVQVNATSPTTIQAKAWADATAEPAAWARTATDSAAPLQTHGSIGVQAYLSGSVTNPPIVASISRFTATTP
ncbi:PKD domain-containing protein [Jatrophihabitans telluris]|uniref:PKD domain-containing protein n=1 Tax=Jatrophihabitans telluris TaxID=2038343 RepID=A0ABY4R0W6_9ACTN|nr:PKD domain-containing protein [Jatrophihabitans telluris]UQX89494.1 PKD domain-containing protein [Jatrophihabitans telluris]